MHERRTQNRRHLGCNAIGDLVAHFLDQNPYLTAGQVGAEAEVCPARAEPDLWVGVAGDANSHGLPNFRSSRLAELYHMETLSPAFILVRPNSKSSVRLRRMKMIGEAHRTISSTAVAATPPKSDHHFRRSSG